MYGIALRKGVFYHQQIHAVFEFLRTKAAYCRLFGIFVFFCVKLMFPERVCKTKKEKRRLEYCGNV